MSELLKCALCGFECKGLTLHLKYKHGMTPIEYKIIYPGAEIFSASVKDKMKASANTGPRGTLEERFGVDAANKIKEKIGKNSGASRLGKKRPQQGETLKLVWVKNHEKWSNSIKKAANNPETKEKHRRNMKAQIERDGYHLARGRETSLELFVRTVLENAGYDVVKQKGTKRETLGTIRFFDI